MKDKAFVTYRFIFVPDKKLSRSAIKLAEEISKLGDYYFRIDDRKFHSHFTIYKAEFPKRNKDSILSTVARIASQDSKFEIHFSKFFAEWGWLGLDFDAKEFHLIHKKLIELLNPLREGHVRDKLKKEMSEGKYNKKQIEQIRKYGMQLVMEDYHPHLSMLRFKDPELAKKIRDKFNKRKININKGFIKEIAVVKGGEHGTVTEFIKRYSLKV